MFLRWVRDLLPEEKYQVFLSLFQFPAFTNELVGDIYNQLNRVFFGRNRAFHYEFTDTFLRDDWEDYRTIVLKEPEVWETTAWRTMKLGINSVMIVDLPEQQTGRFPQPYFYFLPVESVIAYESAHDEIEWIAFYQSEDVVVYFDSETRAKYQVKDGDYILIDEQPHTIGKCPARWFWTDPLNDKEPDVKQSPISKQLSKLDWLLFFEISKHHLDLYAPYPIYSAYEQDCDFSDPHTGSYCDNGFLRSEEGYAFDGRRVAKCPVCSANRLSGVGAMITVPQPTPEMDMRKPVDLTTIDKASLDYNVSEVKRLREDIFMSAVGRGTENISESMNEMQVASGFETKTSVLLDIKRNFEKARKWVTEVVCVERYSKGFTSASINYGTEFYIYTLKDLFEKYMEAKNQGASMSILDGIQDKIIEVENINNPIEMQRTYVIKHLEPYRHLTTKEVVELFGKKIIPDIDEVSVKINLSSLIQRFERENTSVIEFGSELEFDRKIQIIKQTLKNYVREHSEQRTEEPKTEIA